LLSVAEEQAAMQGFRASLTDAVDRAGSTAFRGLKSSGLEKVSVGKGKVGKESEKVSGTNGTVM